MERTWKLLGFKGKGTLLEGSKDLVSTDSSANNLLMISPAGLKQVAPIERSLFSEVYMVSYWPP